MKRLLLTMSLALVVALAVSGVASATHSNGKGPDKDLVSGTGQFLPDTLDLEIHVNAQSGPSGEDAKGRFFVRRGDDTDLDFRGEVTCLHVDGNRATVGGRITQARAGDESLEGRGIVLFIEDNGEGSNNPDDESDGFFTPTPPQTCPPPTFGTAPFEKGNYIVHDATP